MELKKQKKIQIKWYQVLIVIACLVGLIVWFQDFTEYKLSFTNVIYNTELFSWLKVATKGPSLSDPVDQMMQQAYLFMISGEKLTTWNSYNSFGYPITCWDILLNPFNWFYVFGLEWGQLLKYLCKYLVAFVGMYMFLKKKHLHSISCVGGSITYTFSSAIIVWGGWPHSDIIAVVPWVFMCADKIIKTYSAGKKDSCGYWLMGFCGLVYIMLIAGMPTYAAYYIYLGIFYVVFQLCNSKITFKEKFGCILLFMLMVSFAGVMSLVYTGSLWLETSQYQAERTDLGFAFVNLGWKYLSTFVVPYFRDGLTFNINEATLFTGFLWLLIFPVWKNVNKNWKESLFWEAISVVIVLLIFTKNSGYLYQVIPLINSSIKIRILAILNFSLSVIGTFSMEELIIKEYGWVEKIKISCLYLIVLVVIVGITLHDIDFEVFGQDYQIYAYIICFIAVVIGAIICVNGGKRLGTGCIILSCVFIGTLFARDYMPLIDKDVSVLPPETEVMEYLIENINIDERMTAIGWSLYPNTNQYYSLRDIRAHGFAVTDEEISNFYRELDPDIYRTYTFLLFNDMEKVNKNLLGYSSVKYLLSMKNRLSVLDSAIALANTKRRTIPINNNNQLVKQVILATDDGFSGINILLSTYGYVLDENTYLMIELKDIENGDAIFSKRVNLCDIKNDSFLNIKFEPIQSSKDKSYELTIRLSDTIDKDKSLALWITESSYRDGTMKISDEIMKGDLCIVDDYNSGSQYYSDGGIIVNENTSYCPRAYIVDGVLEKENKTSILNEMSKYLDKEHVFAEKGTFSERFLEKLKENKIKILKTSINWERDDGNYLQLKVNTNKESIMVLTDRYNKNWHAYVDGKEVEIYNVNYLFRGIELTEGNHVIEFKYIPKTLYAFLIISVMADVGFIILIIVVIKNKFFQEVEKKRWTY